MNAVEIEHVTKTFGKCLAVSDLSLAVPNGSIYGFIGPNGSGKTTTMRMIMNIFYPDSGVIRVLGQAADGAASDRIGYLPEERGLYRSMKVREVLLFYGGLKANRNVSREVDYWMNRFQITDWASRKLETLSKGMFQKVQFLATVIAQPAMLVLDEPFASLDPVNAEVIKQAVLDLRRQGTTVILSTHDMHTAETMCDYIFMIYKGVKVLDGRLADIQAEYGQDTLRVQVEGGLGVLRDLPGVDLVRDLGQVQELHMTKDCDPQVVLKVLLERTRVTGFEISKPSLHDIFIRIAGAEAQELNHAQSASRRVA